MTELNDSFVTVVLTVDEKFLPYAKVTILSAIQHAKSRPLEIIIGHYGISQEARSRFLETIDLCGRHIVRFVSLKPEVDKTSLAQRMKVTDRFPIAVAYRLVLPEVLRSYERFIYLDSDVIVKADLSELYDMDIGGCWVAAVKGVGFPAWLAQNESRRDWYKKRGINDANEYFNNGIMLVNAKAFRANGLLPSMIKVAAESPYFPDQDALNVACKGHVLFLGYEWNAGVSYCCRRQHDADGSVFRAALENPKILHFNSVDKPWNHPLLFKADEWWRYAGNEDYGPNEIKLYNYTDWPNFGDALSYSLTKKLANSNVTYAPIVEAELLATGSLLGDGHLFFGSEDKGISDKAPHLHVWGSGFLEPQIPEGKVHRYRTMSIHAVRGVKTASVLKAVGYLAEEDQPALGDPGILYADFLLPNWRNLEKKFDIALIPHRQDQVAALRMARELRKIGLKVKYVDVMLSEPIDVLRDIAMSHKVLSSSLHGIIVADSMGIPNRRFVSNKFASCSEVKRQISHYKFDDYYSAFGLKSPHYVTENDILQNPREVVSAIAKQDVVPCDKVEQCKAALLSSFPFPVNARKTAADSEVHEMPVPLREREGRLRVLMVAEPDFLNPYPQTIYNELLEYDLDADCSSELFWTCSVTDYDVVHIQFPEALFAWNVDAVSREQYNKLEQRIILLKQAGCKIFYTRHNERVHIPRKGSLIDQVYKLLENIADGIFHMGMYSLRDSQNKFRHSKARHYLVPHQLYHHIVRNIRRDVACEELGLDANRPVVLSFGGFRNDVEKELLYNAVNKCGIAELQVVAPALQKGGFVKDRELPLYFAAADVVFIQRARILNSGNLPMGFYFGKVVVGPNLCDVGEILRETGNPVFDVFDPDSAAEALCQGLKLAEAGLGEQNRKLADREWNIQETVRKIVNAYSELTGFKSIKRIAYKPYKRIALGDAIEISRAYSRLKNRLEREIYRLKTSESYRIGLLITSPLRWLKRKLFLRNGLL